MAKLLLLLLSFIILVAFGVANGAEKKEQIGVFELKKGDVSVKFTNWGATIVSLLVPDRHGLSPFWSLFFLGFLRFLFLCL